ncbi:MAG: amino acid ABC transporter permease [Anaerolineaceae bacterium]|nr:amino acid ABC transporter permease [Anaerolineaceae bacterium]
MAYKIETQKITSQIELEPLSGSRLTLRGINWREFPWWFAALIIIAVATFILVATQPNFNEAFNFIVAGLSVSVTVTLSAFVFALVLGLLSGLGRISDNVVARNVSTLYVELIRGVPMLVLIFFIALVLVPGMIKAVNGIGTGLVEAGWVNLGNSLLAVEIKDIPMTFRAIIALSITYGAFLAEVFRAGIQSIDRGQMEAARSQGMSYGQAMRYVILPQAIRNVLPALGNDFISMLKDSSLVSVLAVRDITQVARLYAGHSFRFDEAYTTLAILYLTMTVSLSLILKMVERRYCQNVRG